MPAATVVAPAAGAAHTANVGGRGGQAQRRRGACQVLRPCRAWAWVWAAAQLAGGVGASRIEGELPRRAGFAEYVGKFCFDFAKTQEEMVGQLRVRTLREGEQPKTKNGTLYFMIFDDEQKHWKRACQKWGRSTCEDKKEDASLITEIDLYSSNPESNYSIHIREHVRPRFWYFTFVACDGLDLLDLPVRFEVHATNNRLGWQQEFSLDHVGLFAVYVVFTACFSIAGLATAWASRWRSGVQDPPLREHPYIQLLTLSYIASSSACALFLAHYFLFMHNGFGSKRLRFLAVFAGIVANCTIYLIAILSSCGWAITSAVLPNRRCFLGLVSLVGWLHALCELHAEMAIDQSTKLYSYQGSVGVLALVLKVFMFCWFAFQAKASFEEELVEKRRRFFRLLGISVSAWALTVPVTVLLAFQMAPWVRYKVVTSVDIVARFLGQCLLSQLFCGPLSPICRENTFASGDDLVVTEAGFGRLPDGAGQGYDNL